MLRTLSKSVKLEGPIDLVELVERVIIINMLDHINLLIYCAIDCSFHTTQLYNLVSYFMDVWYIGCWVHLANEMCYIS